MKLFGNNIEIKCEYCANSADAPSGYICTLRKSIKNGKCRKFKYNPTLRVPKSTEALPEFKKEDFKNLMNIHASEEKIVAAIKKMA